MEPAKASAQIAEPHAAASTSYGHNSAPTNYRIEQRNGGASNQQQQQQQQQQPRRHYSIIPQLFISYGWGPSGK